MKYHGRNLRKGRYSETSRIYHVTIATADRSPVFLSFIAARQMIRILKYADDKNWSQTLCFTLMPDHLHWLFTLGAEKSLHELIRSIKRTGSRTIGTLTWQRGFHDHAIREEEDIKQIARYIVHNPVRAKIVSSVGDYPHWDAIWLE